MGLAVVEKLVERFFSPSMSESELTTFEIEFILYRKEILLETYVNCT